MDTKQRSQHNMMPDQGKYGKVRIAGKLLTSSFWLWGCTGTTK
jgi:hypothetical protein